ncbi:Sensor kinase CckA [subsurface metagenome]
MAEKASLQAKDLTYKLLTFAKGGEPVKKTTNIVKLIENTVDFALSSSNVRCDFFLPDDLWPVEVDEGQVNQVIHNIIINADQAMPEGGNSQITAKNIIITKKDNLPLKDGKYVKISIRDQGIGILENHLSKIFDPYFTTKHKGSGLGLSTSYSIIKQHDGYITVDSEVGKGTIVYIYLPSSRTKALIKSDKKEKPISGQGRVLLLEDEEIVGKVVAAMLHRVGYEVTVVREGNRAIELYKKVKESNNPFAVVIMDLTIPGGMGGKETIKELLKIDPEIKAIVSSGYSNDPIMSDFKKYGFKAVITKPYDIEEISRVIHKVINTIARGKVIT